MNIAIALPELSPQRIDSSLQAIAPDAIVRILSQVQLLATHLDWAEIVMGNMAPELVPRAPRLRWLQITSSGFEPYLGLKGSKVVLTTGRGLTSVAGAEHVLAMMAIFTRRIGWFQEKQRDRVWDRRPQIVGSLVGQTLGIVGFGANGLALAKRAKAMEMRVVAIKHTAATPASCVDRLGTMADLEGLLEASDHVALMVPLTPLTRGLIDASRLGRMKRGAYLYNVSRGGIVDEAALLERLRNGTLGGAAMDVFDEEPLAADSPWWDAPNVMITPHLGAAWGGMWEAAFELFCDNLRRYLAGDALRNVADLERGY